MHHLLKTFEKKFFFKFVDLVLKSCTVQRNIYKFCLMKREVANYFFVIVVFTGPMVDTNHFAFSSIGENGDFNFSSLTFFSP